MPSYKLAVVIKFAQLPKKSDMHDEFSCNTAGNLNGNICYVMCSTPLNVL